MADPPAPDLPIGGLRVVELSERGAAAYAGKLLRRLGADLVKVEPPEGDPLRRDGSRRHEADGRTTTAAFDFFNEGKTSELVADPPRLRELVAGADAFILDLEPRRYEAWALEAGELAGLGCGVVCAITPFGLSGPYRDYRGPEIVTSAFGGSSVGIGAPGRPPLRMPLSQTAIQAGLVAAIAALGNAYEDGDGEAAEGARVVDIAESDVWATVHTGTTVVSYLFSNRLRSRQGRRVLGQPYPHQLFRCSDGWIAIQASERHQHQLFIEMVGSPEWAAERRFGSRLDMNDRHADEVDAQLAPWFEARTRQQVFEECRARNIPAAPVRTVADVRADADLQAAGAFETFEGASGVELTLPAPPFRFAEAELAPPGAVPPPPEAS